jgi:hypothetical protein
VCLGDQDAQEQFYLQYNKHQQASSMFTSPLPTQPKTRKENQEKKTKKPFQVSHQPETPTTRHNADLTITPATLPLPLHLARRS